MYDALVRHGEKPQPSTHLSAHAGKTNQSRTGIRFWASYSKYSKKSHVSCVTQCHSGSPNTNHFSYNNHHRAMDSAETRS